MKLSINTSFLRDRLGDDFRTIDMLSEVGFDAVDYTFDNINVPNSPWKKADYLDYAEKLKQYTKSKGICFNQAHAPYSFDWTNVNVIQDEIFPAMERAFEICSILEIPLAVVHGLSHEAVMKNPEYQFEANIEYYNQLKQIAKKFNIRIALENLKKVCTKPDDYVKMMDRLNDDCFIACVDVGHSPIAGVNPVEVIRKLGGERVKALHIHDNHLLTDEHLIPGTGKINWTLILEALAEINYSGDFTLEIINLGLGMLDTDKGFDNDFLKCAASFTFESGKYLQNKLFYLLANK